MKMENPLHLYLLGERLWGIYQNAVRYFSQKATKGGFQKTNSVAYMTMPASPCLHHNACIIP
jgi:hypothetical protein